MKKMLMGAVLAALFIAAGAGLTLLLKEEGGSAIGVAGPSGSASDFQERYAKMEEAVRDMRRDLELLREKVSTMPQSMPKAAPVAIPEGTAPELSETLQAMAAKIEQLESKSAPLTADDYIRMFEEALLNEDSAGAMEAMTGLTKLNPPDYFGFASCFDKLHALDFLGSSRFQRRGYANNKLYEWVLTTGNLGISPEAEKALQGEALMAMRMMEGNDDKRAQIYGSFLASQPAPQPLSEEQSAEQARGADRGGRGGRGGFGGGGPGGFGGRGGFGNTDDVYRLGLNMLSRTVASAAVAPLSDIASNTGYPKDVRETAIQGLMRQNDPAAASALSRLSSDSDADIAQSARLGSIMADSPVTGMMVTDVSADSEATRLGLQPGDIVTAANGQPVTDTRDLARMLRGGGGRGGRGGGGAEGGEAPAQAEEAPITLTVYRNGANVTVTVPAGTRRIGISGRGVEANTQN